MTEKNTETNKHPKADIPRIAYTILFLIIQRFISMVIFVIVVIQFIHSWVTGAPNEKLLSFTGALAEYSKQLVSYVGFNNDDKPWPMGDWPSK
jgi:hypothetical protein